MTREELKLVFEKGAPLRGAPEIIEKDANGKPLKFKPGPVIGKAFFESDLEQMGLLKRELKKLAKEGVIKKTTVRFEGGWRNTYFLPYLESEPA